MTTIPVTERDIFEQLHLLDRGKWGEVLDFISYLTQRASQDKAPAAPRRTLTAQELLQSDLVGMWADRQDIGDTLEFARNLRR
ncbi:MAG: hypothetical protein WHX52_19625 [Anaerolineae bacterium]